MFVCISLCVCGGNNCACVSSHVSEKCPNSLCLLQSVIVSWDVDGRFARYKICPLIYYETITAEHLNVHLPLLRFTVLAGIETGLMDCLSIVLHNFPY